MNFEKFEQHFVAKRIEKKIHHQKEKRTHKKKEHETTMAAPSQTPSILHLLDGYRFMTYRREIGGQGQRKSIVSSAW
jgi:hypothetical protein